MTIHDHLSDYAGLPVAEFGALGDPPAKALESPADYAWAVRTGYDEEPFEEVWAAFRDQVDTSAITALVIGYWGAPYDDSNPNIVTVLTEAAAEFPALRSLFLGDIVMEESEISWIQHSDITPLFAAFPDLERFEVRGAEGLVLAPITSKALRTLRFESAGLPSGVVRAVAASDLPNLRRLDLWLGTENYGGDSTPADLAPLLSGERFPALRHLGLEDSENQDAIAEAVAGAAVVAQLETLSLGMGTLTDRGAEALLSGQPLTHLKTLDLEHHFLSEAMAERLSTALDGVDVRLDGRQEPHGDWFFIEVSE